MCALCLTPQPTTSSISFPVTVTFNYYGTPLVERTCKYGMLEFTSRFILRCVDVGACTLAWEVVCLLCVCMSPDTVYRYL